MPTKKLRDTLQDLALTFANQIVAAARTASLGELFDPDVSGHSVGDRVSGGAADWAAKYQLSEGEVDTLCRAALGETQAEIARRRGTSVQTIKAEAARLVRRTRDGSLESAANRLLRDVIDRSPPPVAPLPRGAAAEGGAELQARIEELRRLAAQPPDGIVRYAMGAIVKELKSHPEVYGGNAVSVAAAAVGEDTAGLYRFASVAERWSSREVKSLLSSHGVSWSHLVALARIESRPVRDRFLRRIQREKLGNRQLVAALEKEGLA